MKLLIGTVVLLFLVAGLCLPLWAFAQGHFQVGPIGRELPLSFYLMMGVIFLCGAIAVLLLINNRQKVRANRYLSEQNAALQKAEEELRHNLAKLEMANENLNSFIFAASHDLKESVRSITSFAQLLERKLMAGESDTAGHYTEYIIGSGVQMNNTLEKLVFFSELVGKEQRGSVAVDLGLIAREAWDELQEQYDAPSSLHIGPLPKTSGDPALFYRMIKCLLENAIEFRKEGQPAVVEFGFQANGAGNRPVFVLKDNGQGVGPEYLTTIFEPFKRLNPRGKGGPGLGLSICRRIVEMHRGRIWAGRAELGGLAVYFTLPLAEAPDSRPAVS